jgi:hypothetical protein
MARGYSWTDYYRRQRLMNTLGVIGVILFLVLLIGGYLTLYVSSTKVLNIQITRTERVSYGSGDSTTHKYLVFTPDETFEVTDTLIFGHFDSSDRYGKLLADHRYQVKVVGWRAHFLSWYRNIIEVTPIS